MGRKVFITSDMSTDERLIDVAAVDPTAALLWPWLLTAFDDWGRAEASPKRLKASVFPMIDSVSADTIGSALDLYTQAGLIIRYEVDGKSYMAIPPEKWFKYQTHIRSEKRTRDGSRFPPPPECAHGLADARSCAQMSAGASCCAPSPSPSPTPTPSPTGEEEEAATTPTGRPLTWIRWYEQQTTQLPSHREMADAQALVQRGVTEELLIEVTRRAIEAKKRQPASYAIRVLANLVPYGVRTVEDWNRFESEQKQQNRSRDAPNRERTGFDALMAIIGGGESA